MKRQRGRGRKPGGHHTSNRHFESTGPDLKIRGSAAHIYEKYMQLARDANSSGDRVMAESYLQHAEHYFRVIRAMQPMAPPPVFEQRFAYEPEGDDDDLDGDGEGDGEVEASEDVDPGAGPQPAVARDRHERQDRPDRQDRQDRQDRGDGDFNRRRRNRRRGPYRPGEDRGEGPVAEGGDRPDRGERPERQDRPERAERPDRGDRPDRMERPERSDRPERSERRERAPRDGDGPIEGFGDGPKPAFLAGE